MASELGLLSSTQHQNFAQIHPQQSQPLIWNHKQMPQDEDESWEVRAFEQDSCNITWPPRSYTCTYCTREFRSAQALGGHMNVHRRDRARLHQAPHVSTYSTSTSLASPTFLVPSQEMVNTSGLCFVYSLSNPNGGLTPIGLSSCMKSPSNLTNNLFPSCPSTYTSSIGEHSRSYISEIKNLDCNGSMKNSAFEELDLELRLGRR